MPSAPPIKDPILVSVDSLDDLVNRFGSDDETLAKPTTTSTISSTSTTSTSTSSSTIHTNNQCIGIGYAVRSTLLLNVIVTKF